MAPLKDKDGQTVAAVRAIELTPENSAYSHVVVQWKMDIHHAHGYGILCVLLAHMTVSETDRP